MNTRTVVHGVAALALGSVAVCDFGVASADTPEGRDRQGIDGNPEAIRIEHAPDIRQFKSLTPEERGKRTMRRKLRRVDELIAKGEYEKGETLLKNLRVANDPRAFAQVHNTLGFAYSQTDQPEKAIRHYERVLRTMGAPAEVELSARRQLAGLYYVQGQEQLWDEDAAPLFRKALSSMQKWMKQVPDADPPDYLFLARIQVELGDFVGGIESLETAIGIAAERGDPIETEWTDLLERMKLAER